MQIQTHPNLHLQTNTCIQQRYISEHNHMRKHSTHINGYKHTDTCTNMHTQAHMFTQMSTCICIHTNTYKNTDMRVQIHIRTYTNRPIHACTHKVHRHKHIHICAHIQMYVYAHTCAHPHIHSHNKLQIKWPKGIFSKDWNHWALCLLVLAEQGQTLFLQSEARDDSLVKWAKDTGRRNSQLTVTSAQYQALTCREGRSLVTQDRDSSLVDCFIHIKEKFLNCWATGWRSNPLVIGGWSSVSWTTAALALHVGQCCQVIPYHKHAWGSASVCL